MTSFVRFSKFTKMRYDYGDMIQVRYQHSNGESYDSWVSGEETLQRLKSEAAEDEIRELQKLSLEAIKRAMKKLPNDTRRNVEDAIRNRTFDEVEDLLGDSIISESLTEAMRGGDSRQIVDETIGERWRSLLQNAQFKAKVVELAWIQLEGSFPEEETLDEPDDWI